MEQETKEMPSNESSAKKEAPSDFEQEGTEEQQPNHRVMVIVDRINKEHSELLKALTNT